MDDETANPETGADAPLDLLDRATRGAGLLVAGVGPDQWHAPTPCEDMDVLGLVEHMIAALDQFAEVGRGGQLDPTAQRPILPDAAAEEYRTASDGMKSAWSAPGAIDRDHDMPWGATPGAALVEFMFIEEVAHGWDLGRATGQSSPFDEDLVRLALDRARQYDDETIRVPGMFGPAVDIADDAPMIDRLAAFLGRHP